MPAVMAAPVWQLLLWWDDMAVGDYILVSDGSFVAPDGATVAAGVGVGHILYDPQHQYTPPPNTTLQILQVFRGQFYEPAPLAVSQPVELADLAAALNTTPDTLLAALATAVKATPFVAALPAPK